MFKFGSACRWASTASGLLANVPAATASQSTTVITASTVAWANFKASETPTSGLGNTSPGFKVKCRSSVSAALVAQALLAKFFLDCAA